MHSDLSFARPNSSRAIVDRERACSRAFDTVLIAPLNERDYIIRG
jgi:hypothetical protein